MLGTAGHIDHGKTALIRALTGVDTDRLPEEKARGITIDLGFAPLDLGEGLSVSVVDVPGHERLVRTMVSGATGIDIVLLVVAADEASMPQTREHVAICDLLGIERGVVALTKSDLVDDEVRELAEEDVEDLLAATSLGGSPIVQVSSVTGAGTDALRAALRDAVLATGPRTPRTGPPRLGVDRVFAMRGFGTVVTGTLVGGALAVGETVEVYPTGLRARIRGLQTHGEAVEQVAPGARCAINLQGLEVSQLGRGEVVSRPDALTPTATADLELSWLEGAPAVEDTVAVEFLTGTCERRARLSAIGRGRIEPGSRSFARLHIEGEPVAMLPGDRFIARGFSRSQSIGSTLGGGIVLDVAPPHRRRSDPALSAELAVLARRDAREDLLARISRSGLSGAEAQDLARTTGLSEPHVRELLEALEKAELVSSASGRRWLAAPAMARIEAILRSALDDFHAVEPLRPGMPRGALRGALPDNVPTEAVERALSRLEAEGAIAIDGDTVRRSDFEPRLDEQTRALVERIRSEAGEAALEPPAPREWAERLGTSTERLRDLLAYLEREGSLVRAPGDLWFDRKAVDDLRSRVVDHLREQGELDTQTYKSLIGTTRRTAMPLMELLDDLRITRRRGDTRILRSS